MIRTLIYVLLLAASAGAQALSVPDALSMAAERPSPVWMRQSAFGDIGRPGMIPPIRGDSTQCQPVVPIPAAIWLFASALAGFAVIGRRR